MTRRRFTKPVTTFRLRNIPIMPKGVRYRTHRSPGGTSYTIRFRRK